MTLAIKTSAAALAALFVVGLRIPELIADESNRPAATASRNAGDSLESASTASSKILETLDWALGSKKGYATAENSSVTTDSAALGTTRKNLAATGRMKAAYVAAQARSSDFAYEATGRMKAAYVAAQARSSDFAYEPGKPAPSGFEVINGTSYGNGLSAAALRNMTTGEISIVYRGTLSQQDLLADVGIGPRAEPTLTDAVRGLLNDADVAGHAGDELVTAGSAKFEQYVADAHQFAVGTRSLAKDQYPNAKIVFVGHSLGGGLAQVEAARTGDSAVTFNPPGMGEYIKEFIPGADTTHIVNHRREGDLVSMAGTQAGITYSYPNERTTGFPANPIPVHDANPYVRHNLTPFANALAQGMQPIGSGEKGYLSKPVQLGPKLKNLLSVSNGQSKAHENLTTEPSAKKAANEILSDMEKGGIKTNGSDVTSGTNLASVSKQILGTLQGMGVRTSSHAPKSGAEAAAALQTDLDTEHQREAEAERQRILDEQRQIADNEQRRRDAAAASAQKIAEIKAESDRDRKESEARIAKIDEDTERLKSRHEARMTRIEQQSTAVQVQAAAMLGNGFAPPPSYGPPYQGMPPGAGYGNSAGGPGYYSGAYRASTSSYDCKALADAVLRDGFAQLNSGKLDLDYKAAEACHEEWWRRQQNRGGGSAYSGSTDSSGSPTSNSSYGISGSNSKYGMSGSSQSPGSDR